jgi:hypothetical protein
LAVSRQRFGISIFGTTLRNSSFQCIRTPGSPSPARAGSALRLLDFQSAPELPSRCRRFSWVREWRCRHSLPVVAIGSIPYIYRLVAFQLRATPACDGNPRRGLRFLCWQTPHFHPAPSHGRFVFYAIL